MQAFNPGKVLVGAVKIQFRACLDFTMMGRGPALPVVFQEGKPPPGPSYHIFQYPRTGLARPVRVSNIWAVPARLVTLAARRMRHGLWPARHFHGPVGGLNKQGHGPAYVLSRTER